MFDQVRISAMPGVPGDSLSELGPASETRVLGGGRQPDVPDSLADSDSFCAFQSMTSAPDEVPGSEAPL